MPPNDSALVVQDPLGDALNIVARSIRDEAAWTFPEIDHWMQCFKSLDEALPFAALLEAGQRYFWWISGDLAEALMRQFGRTKAVKAALGAVFGCKARTVDYRAKAAVTFNLRFPDVPTDLYKEALLWPDPNARLESALATGANAYQLRLLRASNQGRPFGPLIWTRIKGHMSWYEDQTVTRYVITLEEEGGTRFANNDIPVVVSVAPLTEGQEEDAEIIVLGEADA